MKFSKKLLALAVLLLVFVGTAYSEETRVIRWGRGNSGNAL